jgi:heat shock protein HtpX
MDVWKLRASMAGTLALIIGLSTLFFAVILSLTGYFDFLTLGLLVGGMNVVQWLISPYLINAMYRAKEISQSEQPKLHEIVSNLSRKSGIKKPKLMLAQIPLPNAFAYGSPIAGTRVAVTEGLLKTLDDGEVEAVLGHELGHLKHRDVQVMMFVSILPAIAYFIGYSTMISSAYSRGRNQNDMGPVLGIAFMAFSWVMNLFILSLSRQREYYADRHSASTVENGSQKLSTGLAKIVSATRSMRGAKKEMKSMGAFKALFIADPDRAEVDSAQLYSVRTGEGQKMVDEILSKNLTTAERLLEILSTHPNIIKRLRALKQLS